MYCSFPLIFQSCNLLACKPDLYIRDNDFDRGLRMKIINESLKFLESFTDNALTYLRVYLYINENVNCATGYEAITCDNCAKYSKRSKTFERGETNIYLTTPARL